MAFPWAALIGAGMGLYQNKQNQQQAAKQRQRDAILMQYSPWTGVVPDVSPRGEQSPLAAVGQGALAGLAQDQAMENAASQRELLDAQKQYFRRAGSNAQTANMGGQVYSGDPVAYNLALQQQPTSWLDLLRMQQEQQQTTAMR